MSLILGHAPFGVSAMLLVVCLGIFIYLSISMFKKSKGSDRKKAEKMGVLFAVISALIAVLLVFMSFRHFLIHKVSV